MNLANILSWSGPVLQAWLVALLVPRGAHRIFRFFFGYTVFAVAAQNAKVVSDGKPFAYFYIFWTTETLYALLGFAALYEVFDHLFRHFYYLRGFKLLFPGAALVSLVLSTLWTFLHGQPVPDLPLLTVIFALELAVRWLQTGLLVLIFCLAVYYEQYSQHRAFGIAAGFGISALGTLAMIMVRSEFGTKYPNLLLFLAPVAYLVAILIWLISFIRPEPPDYFGALRGLDARGIVRQIKQWKKEAKEKLGPWFNSRFSGSGLG